MRTTWEMQCKGLWGLSLGFPSAAYSLHFISWLTKCVAIHLEPTEVLWSTLLTSTPHNRQKKFFAAKIPVSCRRMLLEARLETSSMVFPHQGERSSCLIHPTEPTNCPLGQPEGPASHAVPKQAHKLAVSFLCATPWLCEALRSLPTPCLNGTRSCCIGAPGHVCFGDALSLQRPSLPLHAQVYITSIQEFQRFFSHRNHNLRPAYGL